MQHSPSLVQPVQINDYDTYLSTPSRLDNLYKSVSNVPLIRVFGSLTLANSSNGSPSLTPDPPSKRPKPSPIILNALVHIHNYYPYLYIDCHGVPVDRETAIERIESLLVESYTRNRKKDDVDIPNPADSDSTLRKYVATVGVCSATPAYGYYPKPCTVYKVLLLSQAAKLRLAKVISDSPCHILHRDCPQPLVYEAHLPFLLQFLADFDLYGCGWMNILFDDGVHVRSPVLRMDNDARSEAARTHLLTSGHLTHNNVLSPTAFPRMGSLAMEWDALATSILNRCARASISTSSELVHLSSLKHVYRDLMHQCAYRGLSHVPKIVPHVPPQINTKFSSTNWLNQAHLDELLQSAIAANKDQSVLNMFRNLQRRAETDSVDTLEHAIVPHNNAAGETRIFQSAFELGTSEMSTFYDKYPLRLGPELLKWVGSDSLFKYVKNVPEPAQSTMNRNDSELYASDDPHSLDCEPELLPVAEENVAVVAKQDVNGESQSNVESDNEPDLTLDEEPNSEADPEIRTDHGDEFFLRQTQACVQSQTFGSQLSHPIDHSQPYQSQLCEVSQPLETVEFRNPSQNNEQPKPHASQTLGQTLPLDGILSYQIDPPSSFEDFTFTSSPEKDPLRHIIEYAPPRDLLPDKIMESFDTAGVLQIDYRDPFYDRPEDVPPRAMILADRKITVPLISDESVSALGFSKTMKAHIKQFPLPLISGPHQNWIYMPEPPLKQEMQLWVQSEEHIAKQRAQKFASQIDAGKTQGVDFKLSYNSNKVQRSPDGFHGMTVFHLEMHASTKREGFAPNPQHDPVVAIFYNFDDSNACFPLRLDKAGAIIATTEVARPEGFKNIKAFLPTETNLVLVEDEKAMILHLIDLIHTFDPDILSGYEINAASWGYIIERFRVAHDIDLMPQLGRCNFKNSGKFGDRWGYTHTSNIRLTGRHTLNLWRILRNEVRLNSYSLANVCYHLLHFTLPCFLNYALSELVDSGSNSQVMLFLSYHLRRVKLTLKIMDVQEIVIRNIEHSRLVGIDFLSVFYRGSQYKVESILLRLAKQENILLNSPSQKQVHNMRSIDCIPLVMEPASNFYKLPLVVVDFQSLYPSIMIAYNYCYTTMLGRLHRFRQKKNVVGYLKNLNLPLDLLSDLYRQDSITLSPNGCMFVKSNIRESLLSKMLHEILNLRIEVKTVMGEFADDSELRKLYHARQLALKLIANVTYGYTSATFSGRMPNSDIADAIVLTGREILTQLIDMIESAGVGAKVVYGDTDSLFIYFPGRTREYAFEKGRQLAKMVLGQFPDPIKLKFEKVYHPCVLLSKKRYFGFSYELEHQTRPKFDAKGIETVRRDGIPAQQKIVERTARILFESQNLSRVKSFVMDQFKRIAANRIAVNDFCFAKEVRYGTYKNEQYLPPGAIVAAKRAAHDERLEPQYRERVPYLVIRDITKQRIKDRSVLPQDYVASFSTPTPFSVDYEYYITRVLIPPLHRILCLVGVDVKQWYRELPKAPETTVTSDHAHGVLGFTDFIRRNDCVSCGARLNPDENSICSNCSSRETLVAGAAMLERRKLHLKLVRLQAACEQCGNNNFDCWGQATSTATAEKCCNLDCAVFFGRVKAENALVTNMEAAGKSWALIGEW